MSHLSSQVEEKFLFESIEELITFREVIYDQFVKPTFAKLLSEQSLDEDLAFISADSNQEFRSQKVIVNKKRFITIYRSNQVVYQGYDLFELVISPDDYFDAKMEYAFFAEKIFFEVMYHTPEVKLDVYIPTILFLLRIPSLIPTHLYSYDNKVFGFPIDEIDTFNQVCFKCGALIKKGTLFCSPEHYKRSCESSNKGNQLLQVLLDRSKTLEDRKIWGKKSIFKSETHLIYSIMQKFITKSIKCGVNNSEGFYPNLNPLVVEYLKQDHSEKEIQSQLIDIAEDLGKNIHPPFGYAETINLRSLTLMINSYLEHKNLQYSYCSIACHYFQIKRLLIKNK